MSAQLQEIVAIRPMYLEDVEAVVAIEYEIYPFPWTYGNFREPGFSPNAKRSNWSGGIGLVPYVGVFGRFVDYTTTAPGSAVLTGGIRDLSPNVKIQIPPLSPRLPNFAVGVNDFAGGAVNFRSAYGVASDQYGPLRWSAGYAFGRPEAVSSFRVALEEDPDCAMCAWGEAWALGPSPVRAPCPRLTDRALPDA